MNALILAEFSRIIHQQPAILVWYNIRMKKVIVFSVAVLVLAGIASVSFKNSHSFTSETAAVADIPRVVSNSPEIVIGTTSIPVELARTSAQIQKGLSGRKSLDTEHGMLFMFSKPSVYRFWMPDMHFPLDMIWLNEGRVVDISHDVTNTFDPAKPVYYTPRRPAQYVLEVNAGFSTAHDIRIGDLVTFKNIPLTQ